MEKVDTRKLKSEVQDQLRRQAVRLRAMGKTYAQIAEAIGVYPTTVGRWCRNYQKHGTKGIQAKRKGRKIGECRTLNPEQEMQLKNAITDKTPDQFNFSFAWWTRRAVQQLIKQLFFIDMPIRTVGEYLKRWGFTPQKPLRLTHKQNPKAVKKWLDEPYLVIAAKAKKEKFEIHWGDEAGICSDDQQLLP